MNGYYEDLRITRAEFDDIKALNSLVAKCGGITLVKATFGNYNFPTVVENSYLSLVASETFVKDAGGKDINCTAFLVLDDSNAIGSDGSNYMSLIEAISEYIPVTVQSPFFAYLVSDVD